MEQGNGNRFWDYPFGNQIWRLRSGTWQLFSSYRKDPSGRDIHFFQALYQICLLTAQQLCHKINMQDDESRGVQKEVNSQQIRKYEGMGFDKGQMEEIRQGLEKGLDVSWYTSVNYDWFQMEEIKKGLERGLDVSVYAKPEISYDRMRQIRKALKEGLDVSRHQELEAGYLRQIRKAKLGHVDIFSYIEEGYEPDQLEEIRLGLEHKADISKYLIKEFLGESLREIRLGVEEGLEVSVYAKIYFGWQQMREIRLGLERRVDVSIYAKELYRWQQMREIRLGLEEGLDVSAYQSMMYSAKEMKQIRQKLQEQEKKAENADIQLETLMEQARQASECLVTVSQDKMEAYVTLEKGTTKTKNEIMRLLAKEHVVFGIRQDEIEKNLKEAEFATRRFLAAEGIRPERGRDGYYEFFFRTGIPQIPAIRKDGSIDYQNTVYFEQVKAGQVIAVYHEAQPGIGGRMVDGTELPAHGGAGKVHPERKRLPPFPGQEDLYCPGIGQN